MPRDIPEFLQRRGIVRVTDNLAPGEEVAGFEHDFALIFRDELLAKFYGVPMPEKVVKPKVEKSESAKAALRAYGQARRARIKKAKADLAAVKSELNRMAAQTEVQSVDEARSREERSRRSFPPARTEEGADLRLQAKVEAAVSAVCPACNKERVRTKTKATAPGPVSAEQTS